MKQIDAKGIVLGRLATQIADIIRGKDKTNFVLNRSDIGEEVEILNADKIVLTGNKVENKVYYRRPNTRPGGLKTITLKKLLADNKYEEVILNAVSGMLPKNKLRKIWMQKINFKKGE